MKTALDASALARIPMFGEGVTKFLDGPAKGETLSLEHAPALLRVTMDQSSLLPKWDALDAIADTASANEFIYAYRRVGPATSMHVYNRGRGARSGWIRGGNYALVDPQPAPELLRDNRRWYDWVNSQVTTEAHD